MIFDSAEWTITGDSPAATRLPTMAAMLFQLGSEETLVPPNFMTTRGEPGATFISMDPVD